MAQEFWDWSAAHRDDLARGDGIAELDRRFAAAFPALAWERSA